jgi:CRP-like cAMP-binding protein/DNA-binding NarL/FixJ family response regulator
MAKILVIEDNAEVRENTAEILTLASYEVTTAPNGKVGIEKAQQQRFDLIICDIMMPELDGYGVLHILNKNTDTAAVPFIFVTAKVEKTDIRKGMTLGADDYLTKPFDDTDLLNAVEARLRKRAIVQASYDNTETGLHTFIADVKKVLRLEDLCRDEKQKNYKKKAIVFDEGESSSYLYFIKSGQIKTLKVHPDGKELIMNVYKAGDFIGVESILQNEPYIESAIALEDAELVLIPKTDFLTIIYAHIDIAKSFISLLCRKVKEKETQLLHLAYNSIRQRTAEALLKLHSSNNNESTVSIAREDLAKIVGTATESVIRVLSDFKEEGLVDIAGGKITIKQVGKLEQVVRWSVARK